MRRRTTHAPRWNARWCSRATTCRRLLYALALHRHLGQCLPDYRFDEHFGGVLYLFVRGVRPGWTLADGSAAGVHAQRPTLQLLDELSALFDGEGVRA